MREPHYVASIIESAFLSGIAAGHLFHTLKKVGFSTEEIALGFDSFLEKNIQEQ